MWLCHDNEVRATEACLSDWVIAWGLLPPPSFITAMIVFSLSFLPLSLSVSPSVSLFPFPVPAFAFVPFQLFINTWWMLLCKKVSLKSFSLWVMNISCAPCSAPTTPIIRSFSGCMAGTWFSNTGHLSDTHSLLSVTSVDMTRLWAPAPPFTLKQPETFECRQTWEIGVDWHHIIIMSCASYLHFTPHAAEGWHASPPESDWSPQLESEEERYLAG